MSVNDTSLTGGVVDASLLDGTEELASPSAEVEAQSEEAQEPAQISPQPVQTGFGAAVPVEPEPVTQPGNLVHNNQSNQPATPEEMRKDFFKDLGRYGKASGEGASALPRLGLRTLRAAADGIVSTAKPAGGGKSDAVLIYEAYAAADSKHSEHTSGGMKANAAKLNAIIGMGVMTTCDPVAVGDKTVRLREEMEAAELKPKALFAALVDVARAQQASDTELTDNAIKGILTKDVKEKTLEKEWDRVNKIVEGLISGENPAGLKDNTDEAHQIGALIYEKCKGFKASEAHAELVETLMEKGYTRAQADNMASGQYRASQATA